MTREVKHRRRGRTTVSSKHQVTLPVDALARAGLATGDQLAVEVVGPGQLILRRVADPVEGYSGVLTGIYEPAELDRLRDEWR